MISLTIDSCIWNANRGGVYVNSRFYSGSIFWEELWIDSSGQLNDEPSMHFWPAMRAFEVGIHPWEGRDGRHSNGWLADDGYMTVYRHSTDTLRSRKASGCWQHVIDLILGWG